ncbi:hypothetical protein ACWDRB_62275 [Nonomuraea sp. NPDC003707]
MEEQRLLLALDFAGSVTEVLPQPFRLRFGTGDGLRERVPDFLAVLRDEPGWLFDVRPAPLIRDRDEVARHTGMAVDACTAGGSALGI